MFETYFSLAEIASHIPKSAEFWRRELKRGAFSPRLSDAGQPDLSNVVEVGGEFFVPASGVAFYLDAHRLGASALAGLVNGRQRQPAPGRAVFVGRRVRTIGELRRTIDQEASNGQ